MTKPVERIAHTIILASFHLTLAQLGGFSLLFCAMVLGGPARATKVARLLRSKSGHWRRLEPILRPMFQVDEDVWTHPVADEIKAHMERNSERQKRAAMNARNST